MPKEIPKAEQPKKQEKAQEEEPVFATPEELAEKEQLLQVLKEAEKDDSIQGLEKQKEILIKMNNLDERRKQRIAGEKEGELEEVYDKDGGIFTNIRFKEGVDKKTGMPNRVSRHAGRPLVILSAGIQEIVPNKPYKARVEKISSKGVIYVRIIE